MPMMDYTEIRRIVEVELKTNFTTCPIAFENVGIPPDTQEWVGLQDKLTFSESTGMGEPSFHTGGQIILGIFVPKDTGTQKARAIATELANMFGNKEIEGLAFESPEFHGNPGSDLNNPWYQMNLVIPYSVVVGQAVILC